MLKDSVILSSPIQPRKELFYGAAIVLFVIIVTYGYSNWMHTNSSEKDFETTSPTSSSIVGQGEKISTSSQREETLKDQDQSVMADATYTFKKESTGNGQKFRLFHEEKPISYQRCVELMHKDEKFLTAFLNILRTGVDYKAYFFETPGITHASVQETPFEFILNDARSLVGVPPDVDAFQDYFGACKTRTVATFYNLGRDALLVAPCPLTGSDDGIFAHLASFVRHGQDSQVRAFWREVGEAMQKRLSDNPGRPIWLSTSGLGVYWLHIRMDTTPKYYTYHPYAQQTGQ